MRIINHKCAIYKSQLRDLLIANRKPLFAGSALVSGISKQKSRVDLAQEGVMNSPLGWFEVSGHRDVTT